MILTKKEQRFIKLNQGVLERIFNERLLELRKLAADLDPNLTAEEFKIKYLGYQNFINEMRQWLREIRILARPKKKPNLSDI